MTTITPRPLHGRRQQGEKLSGAGLMCAGITGWCGMGVLIAERAP